MLGGCDGYTALGTGKVLINSFAGNLVVADVMNYIHAAKTLASKAEGRIVLR